MRKNAAIRPGRIREKGICLVMAVFTAMILLVPAIIFWVVSSSSIGLLAEKGFIQVLLGETWKPMSGQFGLLSFMTGSVTITLLALAMAFPLSICVAIYISEYSSRKINMLLRPIVDLLAGLPSVLYGIWGILVVVPFVRDVVSPLFGVKSTGLSVLSASLVLGLMVLPVLVQICCEVIKSVPQGMREAAFSLGATKAEVIIRVVLAKSGPGIVAAVILALARAFGETIAVMMVLGFSTKIPENLFSAGATLPSLLANNYGEMSSHPLYAKALMTAAFVLLAVIVAFNTLSRMVMGRLKRSVD